MSITVEEFCRAIVEVNFAFKQYFSQIRLVGHIKGFALGSDLWHTISPSKMLDFSMY
jgi:hypothetical protein